MDRGRVVDLESLELREGLGDFVEVEAASCVDDLEGVEPLQVIRLHEFEGGVEVFTVKFAH